MSVYPRAFHTRRHGFCRGPDSQMPRSCRCYGRNFAERVDELSTSHDASSVSTPIEYEKPAGSREISVPSFAEPNVERGLSSGAERSRERDYRATETTSCCARAIFLLLLSFAPALKFEEKTARIGGTWTRRLQAGKTRSLWKNSPLHTVLIQYTHCPTGFRSGRVFLGAATTTRSFAVVHRCASQYVSR